MNDHDLNALLVEARARIIWGEEPSSVRYYLTTNGMSEADADAKLGEFILERNDEIRGLGVRDVLIGLALLGGAGIICYACFRVSHIPRLSRRAAEGYAMVVLMAMFGVWKLINGIPRLILPKSEHGSIPDISE